MEPIRNNTAKNMISKKSKFFVALIGALASFTITTNSADAAVLAFSGVTGFSGGDSYTPQDFTPLTNGFGINKPDADDPSTWTNGGPSPNTATYKDEWYDHYLTGAANGKLGWVAFDLGSSQTTLGSLYLINADAQGNVVATSTFNIYYADTPTVALPSPPGGNSSVDYDFASGGWTPLGVTRNIGVATSAYDYDLSSIASARYIAVEIMTSYTTDGRVGFDEAAITVIPEPSAALLGAFGALALLRRRR